MKTKNILLIFGIIFLISFACAMLPPDPYGDYDGDGEINKNDNCYYVYNPHQLDDDSDERGNCCDADYVGLPGWCDFVGGFCGDGICGPGEDSLSCPADCPETGVCGDGIINAGEECDMGIDNGVACDNSTSSCDYCSLSCEIITLPYEDDNGCCKNNNELEFYCSPNWDCGGWSSCHNGIKTRNCKDTNYCEVVYNKPIEKVGCDEPISEKVFGGESFDYLFLIFSLLSTLLLIVILVLVLRKR